MTTRTRKSKREVAHPPLLSITCWDRVAEMQDPERYLTLQNLTYLFQHNLVSGETVRSFIRALGFTKGCALHYVEVLASLICA